MSPKLWFHSGLTAAESTAAAPTSAVSRGLVSSETTNGARTTVEAIVSPTQNASTTVSATTIASPIGTTQPGPAPRAYLSRVSMGDRPPKDDRDHMGCAAGRADAQSIST